MSTYVSIHTGKSGARDPANAAVMQEAVEALYTIKATMDTTDPPPSLDMLGAFYNYMDALTDTAVLLTAYAWMVLTYHDDLCHHSTALTTSSRISDTTQSSTGWSLGSERGSRVETMYGAIQAVIRVRVTQPAAIYFIQYKAG